MLRLEFFGRPAARHIRERGHARLQPVGMREAHRAHVQIHLRCHILGKDARIEQQQCLRALALAPVGGAFDDALQLGAAGVIELEGLSCRHGLACFGVGEVVAQLGA